MYFDVPFVPTPFASLSKVLGALDLQQGDVVYELGSGDGRLLMAAARAHPDVTFLGIERNLFLHYVALARRRLNGSPANVAFTRGNFFEADLAPANKFYMYMLPEVMAKLLPQFEARRGVRVVSRAFPFPHTEPLEIVELSKKVGNHGQHLLYVYEF